MNPNLLGVVWWVTLVVICVEKRRVSHNYLDNFPNACCFFLYTSCPPPMGTVVYCQVNTDLVKVFMHLMKRKISEIMNIFQSFKLTLLCFFSIYPSVHSDISWRNVVCQDLWCVLEMEREILHRSCHCRAHEDLIRKTNICLSTCINNSYSGKNRHSVSLEWSN